jgi:hypothetical protein
LAAIDERQDVSAMLGGILFLVLVLAIAVLITVDVVRMPNEAPAGAPDLHSHDGERSLAGAHSGAGIQAFSRPPVAREQPVPVAGRRVGTSPAEADFFERPDQTAHVFDEARRDFPPSQAGDDVQRGKSGAMFVNLSRRSQALVERQLRLIESLGHGEQDRERLASLSRLNRIAMRIHRNSQNLLVLAGQEPATGWSRPVTLAHLVEAALGEVEDYERVSAEVQPDIAVRGPAVHDAVHLLVELIDNATSFSAADMPVRVKAHVLTTGGALVDITDRGIGMAAHEMAYANQQLDHPPPPDIDIPKWMGLLVVARLAARHGIRVRLNQAEFGGLTALVWLPDEILTHYSAAADPGRPVTAPRRMAAGSRPFVSARIDQPAARPEPASPRPEPASPQPEPAWSGPGPQAESHASVRRLRTFDEIDSRWSRATREAPGPAGPAGLAAAAGPPAGGLPRRPPPGTHRLQRRSPQSRTPAPEEGNPGGSDEP